MYCSSCKKKLCEKNSSVRSTCVSTCAICGKKKLRFIKNQEAIRLELHETNVLVKFKMNKILNMFMSAGDKFIPRLHLRHSKFTLSACDSLLKIVKGLENSENQVV